MDSIVAIFNNNFDIFLNFITEWEGYEEFIEPIKNFRTIFVEKYTKTYKPNTGTGAFNVLNHGDFHLKNVLYKMNKDERKVEDFVAVSFISLLCSKSFNSFNLILARLPNLCLWLTSNRLCLRLL